MNLCSTSWSSQYYANDWPAQHWANAYAAFSGYVEWAGWGTDGFVTLGRYVVVRNGYYRSLTAHLSSIESGITWGDLQRPAVRRRVGQAFLPALLCLYGS